MDKFLTCVDIEGPHWMWVAKPRLHAYGCFYWDGVRIPSHRAVWMMFVGPLTVEDELHHECRTKLYCHPLCLKKTDHPGNMAEERKTHCLNGHCIAEVGRTKSGNCKQCMKEYLATYKK